MKKKVRGEGGRRRLRWGRGENSNLPSLGMHSQEANLRNNGQKYWDCGRGCHAKGQEAPTGMLAALCLWIWVKAMFERLYMYQGL